MTLQERADQGDLAAKLLLSLREHRDRRVREAMGKEPTPQTHPLGEEK